MGTRLTEASSRDGATRMLVIRERIQAESRAFGRR